MSSIFPFRRNPPPNNPRNEEPAAGGTPEPTSGDHPPTPSGANNIPVTVFSGPLPERMPGVAALPPVARPLAAAGAQPTGSSGHVGNALFALQTHLNSILQQVPDPLARNAVIVASAHSRSVGLGDRRGTGTPASSVVELKGIRLDARVRFDLWAQDAAQAETTASSLHTRLLTTRTDANGNRILRLTLEASAPAEAVSNDWLRRAEYSVLFEHHYQDTDDADSLIVRIPIKLTGVLTETMLVMDEMVRWDNVEAPALELDQWTGRSFRLGSVLILAYLPDNWNGAGVTMSSNVSGKSQQKSFAGVREFLNAFVLATGPVELGGNVYLAGQLAFPNTDFPDPIVLESNTDIFRVQYAAAAFDSPAIVYLRAMR